MITKTTESRYKKFAKLYVSNGLNSAKAARDTGYSEKTARSQGQRLLTKDYVKKIIQEEIILYLSDVEMATVEILNRLDEMIRADIGDYANIESYIISEEWEDDNKEKHPAKYGKRVVFKETANLNTRVISEISEGQHGIKIKMHDPLKAIELKGKYLQIWNDGVMTMKRESEKETMSKEERRNRILELSKKYASE